MSDDPLSELIATLSDGTTNGMIEWQQADSRGRAFIATRSSGTVTLAGRGSRMPAGPASMNIVRLTVKDTSGQTVEEHEVGIPKHGTAALAATIELTSTDAQLIKLWWEVREQVSRAHSTMKALAEEFRSPA